MRLGGTVRRAVWHWLYPILSGILFSQPRQPNKFLQWLKMKDNRVKFETLRSIGRAPEHFVGIGFIFVIVLYIAVAVTMIRGGIDAFRNDYFVSKKITGVPAKIGGAIFFLGGIALVFWILAGLILGW